MVSQIFYLQCHGHNPVLVFQGSKTKIVSFWRWEKEWCKLSLISSHFFSKNSIENSCILELKLLLPVMHQKIFCKFIRKFQHCDFLLTVFLLLIYSGHWDEPLTRSLVNEGHVAPAVGTAVDSQPPAISLLRVSLSSKEQPCQGHTPSLGSLHTTSDSCDSINGWPSQPNLGLLQHSL